MIFYTDGSCLGNGGANAKGGYGVVGVDENEELKFVKSECDTNTTNNRQELKAILYVMSNFGVKENNSSKIPIVYSDSSYCVNTLNDWMFNWAKKGWIKSDKKVPLNLDIIKEYYNLYQEGYRINLKKIKGHAGDKWNELADGLATGRISEELAYSVYK